MEHVTLKYIGGRHNSFPVPVVSVDAGDVVEFVWGQTVNVSHAEAARLTENAGLFEVVPKSPSQPVVPVSTPVVSAPSVEAENLDSPEESRPSANPNEVFKKEKR